MRHLVPALLLLMACSACASQRADASITGTFAGDPVLEGGCAWLESEDDGTRYELVMPEGYTIDIDAGELRGPAGEPIARFGDRLSVTGRVAEDRVSFCQVGPIYTVEAVQPAGS